jgi:hypothetical protein
VGITVGSREVPRRKAIDKRRLRRRQQQQQQQQQQHNNNNNNNNVLLTMLENSICKLSKTGDRTVRNNEPDTGLPDKTVNAAFLIHAVVPNSHNVHSTVTENLQKYRDMKEVL